MKTNFYQQRRVMSVANILQRELSVRTIITSGPTLTLNQRRSSALLDAWDLEHLRNAMRVSVVRFSYVKDNGDIREARGTLCFDLIPTEHIPTTPRVLVEENYEIFRYYDIDSKGWRSFHITGFIGYVEAQTLSSPRRYSGEQTPSPAEQVSSIVPDTIRA